TASETASKRVTATCVVICPCYEHRVSVTRRIAAALAGLLIAVTIALPVSGASVRYFCRIMGELRAERCCESEARPAAEGPQIDREDCCEARVSATRTTPPAPRDAAVPSVGPAAVTTLPFSEIVEPASRSNMRVPEQGVPLP